MRECGHLIWPHFGRLTSTWPLNRDGARRLKRFFDAGGDAIEDLANLRLRWVADPEYWQTDIGDDPSEYADSLLAIGVRDGLLLFKLEGRFAERNGIELDPKRRIHRKVNQGCVTEPARGL